MELLKAKNLIFSYPMSENNALDGVDLSIRRGELALLMGKTGSGKSTLLRLIKSEIAPHGKISGELSIDTDSVAFVSQSAENTFVSERVRGELAFALENMNMKNDEISLKIGEIASFFNIADILDKRLSELSGGEKSTVAIAAAMITGADMLLLDEPLAQLDPRATAQIISLIKRVNNELGTTVIIASHISEGIIDLCDRLVVLEKGKAVADGDVRALAKSESLMPFYPEFTALFDERPLTVKEARSCDKRFGEKPETSMSSNDSAVKIKNLTFAYAKNSKDIFDRLTLDIPKGGIHTVIGANGSGKTTLLKLIAGIVKPYSGKIKVEGRCAYVPQNVRTMFTKDTVGEEISEAAAKRFTLDGYMSRHPYDLSGGEQQLLALAKVSEQDFDVLLLDEPSKSLDAFDRAMIKTYIKSIKESGKTVVIVSHDLDFAAGITDTVSFISDGAAALNGLKREVLSSLSLYTTQIRRITASYLHSAVSAEDLV